MEKIDELSSKGFPITRSIIVSTAKKLFGTKRCKFSFDWFRAFKNRFNLVKRKGCSITLERVEHETPEKLGSFRSMITSLITEYPELEDPGRWINIDESSFRLNDPYTITLTRKGTRCVRMLVGSKIKIL